MKRSIKPLLILCVVLVLSMNSFVMAGEEGDAKNFIIAGSGSSTKVVQLLAQELNAVHKKYEISVPAKSIKHKGGLEWVAVHGMLFGRTGRPMSEEEKHAYPQLQEIPLGKVKIAFAVKQEIGVTTLSQEQFKGIFTGSITNWQEVGGKNQPIILLGRKPGETTLRILTPVYPFLTKAPFKKVYTKEHQMIKAIGQVPGAIGFSTKPNFTSYRVLDIENFSSTLTVGLVYDQKNEEAPTVQFIKEFIQSERWQKVLESHDFSPVLTP